MTVYCYVSKFRKGAVEMVKGKRNIIQNVDFSFEQRGSGKLLYDLESRQDSK